MAEDNEAQWRSSLKHELELTEARFSCVKKKWNFWYYTCLYGVIMLSAFSALVIKSDLVPTYLRNDLAAFLATFSAILGTAMTAGNFEGRWRAARLARNAIHLLRIDSSAPTADLQRISEKLKSILQEYSEAVVRKDEIEN